MLELKADSGISGSGRGPEFRSPGVDRLFAESQNLRISESQNLRISESQNPRIPESQNPRISRTVFIFVKLVKRIFWFDTPVILTRNHNRIRLKEV
jgi:hypothetical protein